VTEGWPGVEGLRVHVDTPPPISTSSTPLSCGYVSSVDTEPRSLGSLRLSTMLRTEILNPRKPRRTWCFMRWPQAQQVEQTRALWEERERAVLPYNRPSIEPPLRRTLKTASMECQASSFIELDSSILHDDFLLMTIQTSGQVLPLALPIFRLLSTFPDPNSDTRSSPWTVQLSHQSLSSTGLTSDLLARQKCLRLFLIYPHLSHLVVLRDRLPRRNAPFMTLFATLSDDVGISILTVKHLCFMLNPVKT